ncbi:hypothetical protein BBJ28_00020189 [Nothophytophthora sp. Chile5]|nr:hypothetical protein BBJ28_00020189 [Nothophytophthora sp. Chile5]
MVDQDRPSEEAACLPSITSQLGTLLELCGGMAETQDMCEDVLERLQRTQYRLDERGSDVPVDIQTSLLLIGSHFHAFLAQHTNKRAFERLVSTHTVITLLRDFHRDLDDVEAQMIPDRSDLSQLNWVEKCDAAELAVEERLLRLWETKAGHLLKDLPDTKSQTDALMLLNCETERHSASYSAKSQQLLNAVTKKVARMSGAPVPAVPEWFIPDHEVQRELRPFDRGSFGEIYRGTWRGLKVVIKCVNVHSAEEKRTFLREARIWHKVQHKHIVKFFGACHLSRPCFFVCEEAENGNLVDYLDNMKTTVGKSSLVWSLLYEVALGLQFLHRNSIVHGDLKCNQILVSGDGVTMLTDFGLSFISSESRPETTGGGVRWTAPECLASEGLAPTFESDVYSFGMCVVEAVTNNLPWGVHLPDAAVMDHLRHRTFLSRPPAFESDAEWQFVRALCAFEPSERPGLSDALRQIQQFAPETIINEEEVQQLDEEKSASPLSPIPPRSSSLGGSLYKSARHSDDDEDKSKKTPHIPPHTSSLGYRTKSPASASAVGQQPSSRDVRMWVGTWNMGSADPFDDVRVIINDSKAMLQNFLPHGYELYVLGIQDGISENVYLAVEAYLNRNDQGMRYYRLELKNSDFMASHTNQSPDLVIDAVHGRGNGVFTSTKFTGIAVFYCASIQANIKLIRAGTHKFKLTSGSKGGVAVALMVYNTTIAFVNCHLETRDDAYRREQIQSLNASLGAVVGHPLFDLTKQFHHVVWVGDLTYRIVVLEPQVVLTMLKEGLSVDLHDKFDGLVADRRENGVFEGFTEPHKFPDFYPTWQKFPNRGVIDESSPNWPWQVYRVMIKQPFYKGGSVKTITPGWSDRILTHSLLVTDSKLVPEKVPNPFATSEIGQPSLIDHYRSVNQGVGMDVSDHSPVFGTFVLTVTRSSTDLQQREMAIPRLKSTVVRIFNMQLVWDDQVVVPKRVRVVAPLVGEDEKQCDVTGERDEAGNGLNLSLSAVIPHTRSLEQLHMLIWVQSDAINGQCTVSLKRIARQTEGGEVKFRCPLHRNSMRLYVDGHPLLVVFSVRHKTFSK